MTTLTIVFVVLAGLNIALEIGRGIFDEWSDRSVTVICGWMCAIAYAVMYSYA